MIDYSKGKIYKIWSPSTDQIYIGSTTKQYLSQRLTGHVIDYKRWQNGKHNYVTSFELVKLEDHVIDLVEAFPCKSKDELHAREGHFIRLFKDIIVNKLVAGRTKKEYNEEYNVVNKDKISKKQKEHYQANKQSKLEKVKQYHQANKQSILETQKQPYHCACGRTIQITEKARHERTQKHKSFIEQQQQQQ